MPAIENSQLKRVSISPELSPGCNTTQARESIDPGQVSISPELSPGCNKHVHFSGGAIEGVSISPELSPGCNMSADAQPADRPSFQSLPSFLRAATHADHGGATAAALFQSLPSFLRAATPAMTPSSATGIRRVSISPELSPGCNVSSNRVRYLPLVFQSLPSFLRAATMR